MSMDLEALRKKFSGDVAVDKESIETASRDASLFKVCPEVVVYPKDTNDIAALVCFAQEQKEAGNEVSLTARSAGTDMTGGPLGESVIVDMTRYLNHMGEITKEAATAEPGVYYRDFERATKKLSRIMPSYPASKNLCTVGGMVANNSGGEKTLIYGKTNRYVRSLDVVLANGKTYTFNKLSLEALKKKKRLRSFEGEVYRKTHALLEKNYELIQSARPKVSKNSAGYALWDVYDKDAKTFDLTQLFTGSQGTLGFITGTTFSLVETRPHSRMLVIFLKDTKELAGLVEHVLRFKPESFESYDDHTFEIALKYFPELVRQMKGGVIKLGIQFLPEFWKVMVGGIPKLVLIAEFTARTEREAEEQALAAAADIASFDFQTHVTRSEEEGEKYWTMRRESFNLLRKHVRGRRTAPFIEDLTVAPEHLPDFLPRLYNILEKYEDKMTYTVAGHVGDGNFHIIPLMDFSDESALAVIPDIMEQAHALTFSFGGSMTGEHNDGLIRSPFLEDMYGKDMYHLFEEVKKIFDPHNIFNPGKKVGATWEYAWEHINREKGK